MFVQDGGRGDETRGGAVLWVRVAYLSHFSQLQPSAIVEWWRGGGGGLVHHQCCSVVLIFHLGPNTMHDYASSSRKRRLLLNHPLWTGLWAGFGNTNHKPTAISLCKRPRLGETRGICEHKGCHPKGPVSCLAPSTSHVQLASPNVADTVGNAISIHCGGHSGQLVGQVVQAQVHTG